MTKIFQFSFVTKCRSLASSLPDIDSNRSLIDNQESKKKKRFRSKRREYETFFGQKFFQKNIFFPSISIEISFWTLSYEDIYFFLIYSWVGLILSIFMRNKFQSILPKKKIPITQNQGLNNTSLDGSFWADLQSKTEKRIDFREAEKREKEEVRKFRWNLFRRIDKRVSNMSSRQDTGLKNVLTTFIYFKGLLIEEDEEKIQRDVIVHLGIVAAMVPLRGTPSPAIPLW